MKPLAAVEFRMHVIHFAAPANEIYAYCKNISRQTGAVDPSWNWKADSGGNHNVRLVVLPLTRAVTVRDATYHIYNEQVWLTLFGHTHEGVTQGNAFYLTRGPGDWKLRTQIPGGESLTIYSNLKKYAPPGEPYIKMRTGSLVRSSTLHEFLSFNSIQRAPQCALCLRKDSRSRCFDLPQMCLECAASCANCGLRREEHILEGHCPFSPTTFLPPLDWWYKKLEEGTPCSLNP